MALGHIKTGAQVTGKFPGQIDERVSDVENPAVFAIVPAQAIFHGERSACQKVCLIGGDTALAVVGMHPFGPALALFLFQAAAGKLQPGGVEIVALAIQSGAPDQGGKVLQNGEVEVVRFLQLNLTRRKLFRALGDPCFELVIGQAQLIVAPFPTLGKAHGERQSDTAGDQQNESDQQYYLLCDWCRFSHYRVKLARQDELPAGVQSVDKTEPGNALLVLPLPEGNLFLMTVQCAEQRVFSLA